MTVTSTFLDRYDDLMAICCTSTELCLTRKFLLTKVVAIPFKTPAPRGDLYTQYYRN